MISSQLRLRRGLSLMEVLFAVGVLMVGLLGIASVLPVGTKNASGALRADASTSAIENQISNALGRFGGKPEAFDVPIGSLNGFNGSGAYPNIGVFLGGLWAPNEPPDPAPYDFRRVSPLHKPYNRVATATAGNAFPNLDPTGGFAPVVPTAFCIDPAFLGAASNLRPDVGAVGGRLVNHYDRTKFPCFDINYSPTVAPGLQMTMANAWPITPRMLRVSLSSSDAIPAPTDAVAAVLLSERDGLPLTKTKDSTRPPGLFFRTVGAPDKLNVQRTGAYSSMVTFAPTSASATNYEVTVVVYEGRQLTTRTLGLDATVISQVFPLAPYSAADNAAVWPLDPNTNFSPPTYDNEVMGVVTVTEGLIQGGVGRFSFEHSDRCNPEVKVGQWLMLMRFDAALGINRYAWYRVSDVLAGPVATGTGTYSVTVEVRGRDWLYHPAMSLPPGTPYPNPITVPTARSAATYVIKCPRVVAVRTMTL
jgi:hypothetical protein